MSGITAAMEADRGGIYREKFTFLIHAANTRENNHLVSVIVTRLMRCRPYPVQS